MYQLDAKFKDGSIVSHVVKDSRLSKGTIIYALTRDEADLFIYLPNTFYVKIKKIEGVE
jgi:hypothetical protein